VIRNLKHLYSPLLLENDVFSLSLSAKYKTEELESFHTIDEALYWHRIWTIRFNCPLFTTENDITFKLNKKRVGTIITQAPTFKNASDVIIEMKEKDFCSLRVSVLTIYVYYIQDFKILKTNQNSMFL
jgi:hypothetical protein